MRETLNKHLPPRTKRRDREIMRTGEMKDQEMISHV